MRILGVHCGHDANAAIVEDGKVLYAVSEERFNRDKFHRGFPFLSIQSGSEFTGLKPSDFDVVVVANLNYQEENLGGNLRSFYVRLGRPIPWYAHILSAPLSVIDNLFQTTLRRSIARRMMIKTLEGIGFSPDKIAFVNHHLAHAAGAFFNSGFKEALIFSIDGKGDHVCHRTFLARNNTFEKLHESRDFDSPGLFYTCITSYLGFKRMRHEGKITGLAAYGNFEKVKHIPSPLGVSDDLSGFRNFLVTEKEAENVYQIYLDILKKAPLLFLKLLRTNCNVLAWWSQERLEEYYKSKFNGVPREHIAAFAQRHLEDMVLKVVEKQLKKYKIPYICLSGGTFGNVRLNQKIAQLDGIEMVYIQPAMGDGGLGVGSALWEYFRRKRDWNHNFLKSVYLGPDFSEDKIQRALKKYNLSYRRVDNIEKYIAQALIKEKIVGRFTGRLEWGPRALGNRTILATATDPAINQILNRRLKRTEFMPFAPIILEEFASQYFEKYNSGSRAAKFMTITFDVVGEKKSQIPAVVHVDGTARPQTVNKDENPSLYKVLTEYYRLTCIPVLINTSFNIHEEPIVCTPEDAIRSYLQGAVDILTIENYLVSSQEVVP